MPARVLRLAGVVSLGPLSAAEVGTLLGVPEQRAIRALDMLADVLMLTKAGGGYRLANLVGALARQTRL